MEIIAVKGSYQYQCDHNSGKHEQAEETFGHCGLGRTFGPPVLWLSCEGQIDVWELFSDNSHLSAILDRQGLQVAAPIDLRTKKAESFSPQLLQNFWFKLKKKNPQIAVMSPTVTTKCFTQKEVVWQQYHLCLAVAEHAISPGKKNHCQWTLQRGEKPKWIFHNLGNLLRPLELVPASRERVVPTEWQVRTVLGDCISRAKVIPVQAPQYRQYALISDFLDLAHLSIQEEAALATNSIKHRPEGLKLQNLALATVTGPMLSSLSRNLTADVQYAINKCESLGPKQQLILHGNPSAFARDFSPHMAVLRRHFLPDAHFLLYVSSGHPRSRF